MLNMSVSHSWHVVQPFPGTHMFATMMKNNGKRIEKRSAAGAAQDMTTGPVCKSRLFVCEPLAVAIAKRDWHMPSRYFS